ncbi:unnamed protein product, partial [Polarella glacialis]
VLLKSPPEALEAGQECAVDDAAPLASGDTAGRQRSHRFRHRGGGRRCEACNLVQPRECVHCNYCEVCVEGHDHHCPWMGKCVGKQNLCAFYSFLVVSFSSLGYIFFIALFTAVPLSGLDSHYRKNPISPTPELPPPPASFAGHS